MTAVTPAGTEPRCLFVLCNDYGELGVAMYTLAGQEFADRSTLLLPPRLNRSNREGLSARAAAYGGLGDVLAAVDRERPDVVLLLSGYLLSLHRNLSLRDIAELVRRLGERGVKIVTSDPFFGLVSDADVHDAFRIQIPRSSRLLRLVGRWQTWKLIRHLTVAGDILRHVPHVYPVYPEGSGGPGSAPRISFYNDQLVTPQAALRNDRRSWLFILGAHDYELQVSLHGETEFLRILRARLDDARHAGRRAVLIGPDSCVRRLGEGPPKYGLELVSFCRYDTFTSMLLEAEYAFYWNVVSYSNLLRLVNGLPVFAFDLGHVVRNVTPLYQRLVDWYYQGVEPVVLDARNRLEPWKLAGLAEGCSESGGRYRERLRRSPTPSLMLRQVVYG